MSKSVAILISSYDGSKSLWGPLENCYKLRWPDCEMKIYLATNNEIPRSDIFNVLNIGNEKSWSDNILKCLDRIKEDYVLLTFDDVFWKSRIDNYRVKDLIERCIAHDWNYLRLHTSPKGRNCKDLEVSEIPAGADYRTSTAMAVFKKSILRNLLRIEENAWEFERNSVERSRHYGDFYVSKNKLLPYFNLVVKSYMDPFSKKKLEQDGISLSGVQIKTMNFPSAVLRVIYVKLYELKMHLKHLIGIA